MKHDGLRYNCNFTKALKTAFINREIYLSDDCSYQNLDEIARLNSRP